MKHVFRLSVKFGLLVWIGLNLGCGNDSSGSRVTTVADSSVAGSLVIQLEPKDGADPATVSGASLQVEGHPEIQATADSSGRIQVNNILPGTLNVIVTSNSGASNLNLVSTSDFGLKLDNIVISAGKANNLGNMKLQATGSLTGTVGFLNDAAVDPEGTLVYIPGTSFSAYTDANGRFVLGGLPPGSYQANLQRDGFAVTKLKDLMIEEGKTTDTGPITLSLALGPEGGITVSNGQTVAISGQDKTLITSRTVELAIRYDSDAVLMKIGKDPAFLNQGWEAVTATKSISFDSEGSHSVYVMFADLNGLESSAYSVNFVIDTLAPELHEIAILNGWAQTAPHDVYVTADITDEGSGIAKIRFSNSSSTLADATWQDYAALNLWTLAAGTGGKTVYAQVKDYAGNTSEIIDDGIVVGSETVIYGTTYQDDVTLKKAFGPYLIESNTSFEGNLILEPGTVLKINRAVRVKLKGQLLAQGTSSLPIIITNAHDPTSGCNTNTDVAYLDMTEAAPGVTEKSRIEFVEFRYMALDLNGGVFKNSSFKSPDCAGSFGAIRKVGLDRLSLQSANFVNHHNISIESGNGLTTIQDSSGDFGYFKQSSFGSNTVFKQNSFTILTSEASEGIISLEKGVTFSGSNTFTFNHGSAGRSLFHNKGSQSSVISGLVVDDQNSSCSSLITDEAGGSVSISRSTIQCGALFWRFPMPGDGSLIQFDRSTLRVTKYLGSLASPGDTFLQFTNSDISVQGTASNYARLFVHSLNQFYDGTANITMQGNKIDCSTVTYCYGFLSISNNGMWGALAAGMDLNIDGNYWTGLPMNANIGSNIVRRSDSGQATYGDGVEHKIYEFDSSYNAITDVDEINYTLTVDPYTNLLTAPTVGPLAP
jgi:hypothetical protein